MSMHIYSRSVDDAGATRHAETVWACTEWSVSQRIKVRTTIHTENKEKNCYARLERWTDTGWHCLFGLTPAEAKTRPTRDIEDDLLNRFADWQGCGHTHGNSDAAVAEWDAAHP